MRQAYSNQELFDIAKENYQTLVFHCIKLHTEGYWTKAERLLNQSIREQLDLYLQAFLLMFAIHSGCYEEAQSHFVRAIADSNVLDIPTDSTLTETMANDAEKVFNAPPILLQLFALRDRERDTNLSVMFVDTMLNIVISMSYLDERKGADVVAFLQDYVNQIQAFLSKELDFLKEIDERYIFHMIASPSFKSGYVHDEKEYEAVLSRPSVQEKQQAQSASSGYRSKGKNGGLRNVTVVPTQPSEPEQPMETVLSSEPEQPMETVLSSELDEPIESTQAFAPEESEPPMQADVQAKPTEPMDEDEIARQTAQARLEFEQARDAKKAAAVQKLLEQLNELVGLETVKEEMQSLVNLIKVRKMRSNYHLPQMDMTYHMVFTGNAGTGKTTVARLVSEIYKELGVLSKGTFVETDRAGLVAGYLGQTAMKVKEVVAQAKGGVLFIDEAYSLTSREAGDDYGIEAIDTLVKEMEDNRNDLVVIVAGYRDEMERFLKSNTGLISRFNKYIDFSDYTQDQLVDILKMMADKSGMTIEDGALDAVREYLHSLSGEQRADFGNARGIRNVFEKIVGNQANRIVQIENPTIDDLKLILKEDAMI